MKRYRVKTPTRLISVSLAIFFAGVLIWSTPMFVVSEGVSAWTSCSVLYEKGSLADNWRRRRRRRRKRRWGPKQGSMSHRILRLLTSLIHYYWPLIHKGWAGTMPHGSGTDGPVALPFNQQRPSCQIPPPPLGSFFKALGCDLHERGAGMSSGGGGGGETGRFIITQSNNHKDDEDADGRLPKTRPHICFILLGVPVSWSFPFPIGAPQFVS